MSGSTPNLGLEYLDAAQSQPEVKVNDAWDKIDAMALSVANTDDSPDVTVTGVKKISFEGAIVEAMTDGGVHVQIEDAGVVREVQWSNDIGAITVPINDVIRFSGATRRIKEVTVLTEGGSGSCVIGVWKANLASHYPPTAADDITGGHNVTISSGVTHQDSTLTDWNTNLYIDDVLKFHLVSSSTFTFIVINLRLG